MLLCFATIAGADASGPPDRAEAAEWEVRMDAPTGSGAASKVSLHLAARAGYHVNLDYPMSFRPSPDSSAKFQGARVALQPASKKPCVGREQETCSVVAELPFTAPATGAVRVGGTFAFSVCTAERCLIKKVELSTQPSAVSSQSSGRPLKADH